jgi:hypothetical protein
MRKFPKQVMSLALGLILFGSLAARANAAFLEDNSSYAFSATGDDSSASNNAATTTMVGSFETNSNATTLTGRIAVNDNGTVCLGSFTSTPVAGSPANTGTMVFTVTNTTFGCITTVKYNFSYATASDFSDVLYFSSNGNDVFSLAGKVQEMDQTDAPPGAVTTASAHKHKHRK